MKHIKEWVALGIAIFGFLGYLIRPSIQYGADQNKMADLVRKAEAAEQKFDLVDRHEIIIPRIEQKLNEINVKQEAFMDRYDHNREEDQRFYRILLTEVKKNNG